MKVLLVGSTGLIGREIYARLQRNNYEVCTLDRNRNGTPSHLRILGNIHNSHSYLDLLKQWKPNIVISTSWITDKESYRTSESNWDYAESTINLAKNAYEFDVQHFIGLGSCAEIELSSRKDKTMGAEDTYAQAKSFAFNEIRSISRKLNRKFTWGRVFQVYGRGQDKSRLIPHIADSIINGRHIGLTNPNQVFDWITSRDVASAVTYSLAANMPTEIEIGTSIGTSVKQIADEVARILKSDRYLFQINSDSSCNIETKGIIASASSPLLMSGWKPIDNISSGLTWMFTS